MTSAVPDSPASDPAVAAAEAELARLRAEAEAAEARVKAAQAKAALAAAEAAAAKAKATAAPTPTASSSEDESRIAEASGGTAPQLGADPQATTRGAARSQAQGPAGAPASDSTTREQNPSEPATQPTHDGPLAASEVEKVTAGYTFDAATATLDLGALLNGDPVPSAQILSRRRVGRRVRRPRGPRERPPRTRPRGNRIRANQPRSRRKTALSPHRRSRRSPPGTPSTPAPRRSIWAPFSTGTLFPRRRSASRCR